MNTKIPEVDTVKVLAKRIAPGQEHLDPYYEWLGKQQWHSDHGTGCPDNVFVEASSHVFAKLLRMVVRPSATFGNTGGGIWGFESRSDADRFVAQLYMVDGLSFWQLGLSRHFVTADSVPLYAYFREPNADRIRVWDESLRTERMRVRAWTLFQPYGRQIGVSAVITTDEVMKKAELKIPVKSRPMMVLDPENSKPGDGAEGLAYKPVAREGALTIKDQTLYWALFQEPAEAQTYFIKAMSARVGQGWHFGLNASF